MASIDEDEEIHSGGNTRHINLYRDLCTLSVSGGYRSLPTGHFRPFGLADADALVWQPLWGECYPFQTATGEETVRSSPLGYIFRPLIALDQAYIHTTHQVFDPTGRITTNVEQISVSQYHPKERKEVEIAKRLREKYGKRIDAARTAGDQVTANALEKQMYDEYDAGRSKLK